MKTHESLQFLLGTFHGPLDLLTHLVQKEEIDIHSVELQRITSQFRDIPDEDLSLEVSSEFISETGFLLWLKSRTLLPLPPVEEELAPEEPDPRFEIIHHLVDYCRFKEAAKLLSVIEEEQNDYFPRGMHEHPNARKPFGIEHLTLDDLAGLFNQVIAKASVGQRLIEGETFILSDVIQEVLKALRLHKNILFEVLFAVDKSKEELIVTFLAVLELMKNGKVKLMKNIETQEVYITSHGA